MSKSLHYTKLVLCFFPLALLWLNTGCATSKIQAYQPTSAAATERVSRQAGLEIAVDPFIERNRTEQFFDLDAVGSGIAILHARISNNSTNLTFLVTKGDIQLIPAGTNAVMTGSGQNIQRSRAGADTMEVVGAVGIGLGGLATAPAGVVLALAGAAMSSEASEIQRNFIDKEMPDQTLAPGESMEGFIYFTPVKKGEDWSRKMTARIRLTETSTHQMTEFNIPF